MSKQEAIELCRAEKRAALLRGVDLTTPQPIPERHSPRRYATHMVDGHTRVRKDAFIVSRPGPR